MNTLRSRLVAPAALTAGVALAVAGLPGLAQEATPPAEQELHPAAIHEGTCTQPTGEPAFDFGDVGPFTDDEGNALGAQDVEGTLEAPPMLTSTETEVDVALDDLLAQPYSVIVHQSEQSFGTYLACGELGGFVQDDQLVIGLRPLNNSGFAGTATLQRADDMTTGNIYLLADVNVLSGTPATTPTPAPSPTPAPTVPPSPTPTTAPATTVIEVTVTPTPEG
jgi:hypothetical protein